MGGRNMIVLVVVALALLLANSSLYVIKQTERGVLLRFGEVVNPDLQPGLHVKIPFVNTVRKFDGRIITVDSTPERYLHPGEEGPDRGLLRQVQHRGHGKFYTATNGERVAGDGAAGSAHQQRPAQPGGRAHHSGSGVRRARRVDAGPHRGTHRVAQEGLGVEVVDVRVKKIDLPPDVSESVYRRMNAEREKEAREHRSQGQELAEGIRAAADREVTVMQANALPRCGTDAR